MPILAARPQVENVAPTTADDQVERGAISDRVEALLEAENFAALNKMAAEFRTTRARTPSGVRKLRVFHMSVQSHLLKAQPRGECVSVAVQC
jgi:hypothetical protein